MGGFVMDEQSTEAISDGPGLESVPKASVSDLKTGFKHSSSMHV